jgi:N-acetylglucosaminyldiphosphoundecaprenol N-acetyl-beta-D-mannosaminyltransferase
LGAREEVVAQVASRYAGKVNLAGWRNGYWSAAEECHVVAGVRDARPDVLFVAMSSPKKEIFLRKWKAELQIPFVMGVGGTFDVVAGVVKRAPVWMQRTGLEWFYRLYQEPRRMWRRYLVEDMAFVGLVWREWLRQR